MELALIPPKSLLMDTNRTRMQLMLPQLLDNRPGLFITPYSQIYKAHCDDPKQYVIMDNGAAESEQMTNQELLHLVTLYGPDEFAIPDVLGDSDATIAKAWNFFSHNQSQLDLLNSNRKLMKDANLKLGFVAQGKTVYDAIRIVDRMTSFTWSDQIKVIYIPRLLVKESDNPQARIEVFNVLWERYKNRFEYHLFGAAPSWPNEITIAGQYKIRSMDTSLPYVMSHHCEKPDKSTHKEEISRPFNYFNLSLDEFPDHLQYVDWFIDAAERWGELGI